MALHFIEKGENAYALWALLHDATEAFLCDVPRPVKPSLSGYKELEDALMTAIAVRFGLDGRVMPKAVKAIDTAILFAEAAQNMNPSPEPWEGVVKPLDVTLQYWAPQQAEANFMHVFNYLTLGTPLDCDQMFKRYELVSSTELAALRAAKAA